MLQPEAVNVSYESKQCGGLHFPEDSNWLAVLSELVKSLPALARPSNRRPRILRLQDIRGEVDVARGARTKPRTLPSAVTMFAAALRSRVPKRIVSGQQKNHDFPPCFRIVVAVPLPSAVVS